MAHALIRSFTRALNLCLGLTGAWTTTGLAYSQDLLYSVDGPIQGAAFGAPVAGAGDVNGDGIPDLIAGARFDNTIGQEGAESGSAWVLSGIDGSVLHSFYGHHQGLSFGQSAGAAGDVNADGFADVIVGCYRVNTSLSQSGGAFVYSGLDGSLLHEFTSSPGLNNFGYAVCGPGDLDNDGFDDLIVTDPSYDLQLPNRGEVINVGLVRAYSGKTGAVLHTFEGDEPFQGFGLSVTGMGDVNGDSHADFAIGESRSQNGAPPPRVRVYSGLNGELLLTMVSGVDPSGFGRFISGTQDLDGDGVNDLVATDEADSSFGLRRGSVRAFSGLDGHPLWAVGGDSDYDYLGRDVAAAGDVNGDGRPDVIAGAIPNDGGFPDPGYARVLSGLDGTEIFTLYSNSGASLFGARVGAVGDVNGDGLSAIIVGADNSDAAGIGAGRLQVFSGGGPTFAGFCFGDGSTGGFCPCLNLSEPGSGCMNSTLSGARLWGTGMTSLSADSVALVATGVPPGRPGLVIQGANQVAGGAGNPLGGGLLCVTGQTLRSQVMMASQSGSLTFNDLQGSPFGQLSLGTSQPTYYQVWYRDSGFCETSNLTNGLEITWRP